MDGRTDGRTDGRMEIHPCVLQDIGPLGPLPKKDREKWAVGVYMEMAAASGSGSMRFRLGARELGPLGSERGRGCKGLNVLHGALEFG